MHKSPAARFRQISSAQKTSRYKHGMGGGEEDGGGIRQGGRRRMSDEAERDEEGRGKQVWHGNLCFVAIRLCFLVLC